MKSFKMNRGSRLYDYPNQMEEIDNRVKVMKTRAKNRRKRKSKKK